MPETSKVLIFCFNGKLSCSFVSISQPKKTPKYEIACDRQKLQATAVSNSGVEMSEVCKKFIGGRSFYSAGEGEEHSARHAGDEASDADGFPLHRQGPQNSSQPRGEKTCSKNAAVDN